MLWWQTRLLCSLDMEMVEKYQGCLCISLSSASTIDQSIKCITVLSIYLIKQFCSTKLITFTLIIIIDGMDEGVWQDWFTFCVLSTPGPCLQIVEKQKTRLKCCYQLLSPSFKSMTFSLNVTNVVNEFFYL